MNKFTGFSLYQAFIKKSILILYKSHIKIQKTGHKNYKCFPKYMYNDELRGTFHFFVKLTLFIMFYRTKIQNIYIEYKDILTMI